MKNLQSTCLVIALLLVTTFAFANGNKKSTVVKLSPIEANVLDNTPKSIETIYKKAPILDKEVCALDVVFDANVEDLTVSFNSTIEGEYTSVEWTFGDGTTSFDASPIHTYKKDGIYYYTVTVYHAETGCVDFVSGNHYVGTTTSATAVAATNK